MDRRGPIEAVLPCAACGETTPHRRARLSLSSPPRYRCQRCRWKAWAARTERRHAARKRRAGHYFGLGHTWRLR